MFGGFGEAGFEAFEFDVQFHAAVELCFLGGSGAEADVAGEALVFDQRGAAASVAGVNWPVSRAAAWASNRSIQP